MQLYSYFYTPFSVYLLFTGIIITPEFFHEISPQGIRLSYLTAPGGYHPPHWHDELEILYPLNGEADINIEGKIYREVKKHILVVESRQVHSFYAY